MKYDDILNSHLKYGTTKEDIISRYNYQEILENVVVAPWWSHSIFDNMEFEIKQIDEVLYNFYSKEMSFSFLELKAIGASTLMEFILPLGVTKCKNIVFIGSAGSLDKNVKIGDVVIPKYSICGDGASRYLNKNLEDEFLKKEYPTKEITSDLLGLLKKVNIKYEYVPNFSVDTIFAQFNHIDKIIELGTKTIEMETASLFKCCEIMNINVTAIFCISDNTILNKSLLSGRTIEDNERRQKTKNEIIPKIVINLLKTR